MCYDRLVASGLSNFCRGRILAGAASGDPAVIVAFDTLGFCFQKRFFLGVFDDFRDSVIDGPDRAADTAFDDVFGESIRMKVDIYVLSIFTYGTSHGVLLSRNMVKITN